MSVPASQALPPVASGLSWTPRVRLYLFEPCEQAPRPDAAAEPRGERATFDPSRAPPDPERPA